MKRTTKLNGIDPKFFSSQLSFHCVPIELKNVLHTNCIASHMTPNKANKTQIIWQHEKGTFSIRIGHMLNLKLKLKYMYGHMTLTPRY
jgi:hypothetical protein